MLSEPETRQLISSKRPADEDAIKCVVSKQLLETHTLIDIAYRYVISFCIIVIGTVLHESEFYANADRYVLMHRRIQQSSSNSSEEGKEESEIIRINPAMKRHFELEIRTLQKMLQEMKGN